MRFKHPDCSCRGAQGYPRKPSLLLMQARGAVILALLSSPACAGQYNDCILEHVKEAQTDQAVYAIKESCLRKVSVTLPFNTLASITGTLGIGTPSFSATNALYVRLRNNTEYTITGLDIVVKTGQKAQTYRVRQFNAVPGPGVIAVGAPKDMTNIERIPPYSSIYFYSEADEPLTKADWNIVGAYGFLAD